MARLRPQLTFANVTSVVALFVALGGSATAAALVTSRDVKNNTLKSADVKNNSLRGADVRNGSLLAGDFKAGQLPAGPQGPIGPQGPAGAPGAPGAAGAPATRLFGAISITGTLLYGSGVTASALTSTGVFNVTFDRSLEGCVVTAGYYNTNPAASHNQANHFNVRSVGGQPAQVNVYAYNHSLEVMFSVPIAVVAFC